MRELRGKVAAVTGAASGIGRALAVELAREGCAVAISDVNEDGLEETRRLAETQAAKVTVDLLDVSDREAVYAWADKVADEHGRVNLIFNNAGVAHSALVEDVTYEDFEWLMGINFWGVVYGTKAFLPHLKRTGDGHIINISSVFGIIGVPTQSTYNSAKFAVRGFTESLREELDMLRVGVSASCVHPGGIKTNIARAARVADRFQSERAKMDRGFDKAARTTPEQAAKTILAGVKKDARRILIGFDATLIDTVQRLAPTGYQKLAKVFTPPNMRAKFKS